MAEAQLVEMAEEISGQMCVNTEWGCFGDDGTLSDILTPYDQHVDQESSNPGEKRCTHPPREGRVPGTPHPSLSMLGPTIRSTRPPVMLLGALKGPRGTREGQLTPARVSCRFEKLVGSLYLGEIVRHVLTALVAEKVLFTGRSVAILRTKDVLKTQQVLEIIK